MGSAFVGRNIRKSGKPGLQRNDASLWSDIRDLIFEARRTVARGVNAALVWTNFEIGRRIVEHEQRGKVRAQYAEETLKSLSQKLTTEFGKGYSVDNLQNMRQFYLVYGKYQKGSPPLALDSTETTWFDFGSQRYECGIGKNPDTVWAK